ncbi:MAG: selenocysteine-specific translation elongation factor [bacterium]|nr:selenocysteine-specific translation elongation factor [bacterium]
MPIIATAGHVDHGKSTLIEALTGRDPDRWAEEKERGLTIDLGFAWQQIGKFDIGFVDVPGHERFIKNMLAGVGAVDVALFVIAADEGWMPQTEEHLAVLDLLDIRHGVIALTRVDLTDEDTLDLTELDVIERVEGTALSDWPIVRVSPIAEVGMEELRRALEDQLEMAGGSIDRGDAQLWIDRSFRIAGAGMVVTGTLSGGSVNAGEELVLWPNGDRVRIRGMQRHDEPVDSLAPGTRAALNITGVDTAERGMLLAGPDSCTMTSRLLGTIRPARNIEEPLTARGAYQLHVGSGSWPVEIRIIDNGTRLIRSRTPIPLRVGDRFILRETGRRAVVAGGRVLDPHPPHSGDAMRSAAIALRSVVDGDPDQIADALLSVRGTAGLDELARDSGGGSPSTSFQTGTSAMAAGAAAALLDLAAAATGRFHEQSRLRPGMPKAELASALGVDHATIGLLVAGSDLLVDDGATVRLADFDPGLTDSEAAAWTDARQTLRSSLAVPRARDLNLGIELLHALERDGQLIRIAPDLVYLPEQVESIQQALDGLGDEFTVAEFRDHVAITRRQAIPLLEWLDRQGVTRRNGDTRTVR